MNLSPALRFLASHHWAIESATFARLVALLERHADGERIAADALAAAIGRDPSAPDAAEPAMTIHGDTAVIPMRGVLARYADGINGMCQARGRSAESLQADLIAAADRGVNRIVLQIDSPGGEVSGTAETADLINQLSARGIQTVAFIDGMAASAAYWIASQCDEIVASAPTAICGSIGVATTLVERNPDNAKGDKLHVITSAPAKASPVLNEAHLANARALVNDLAAAFATAVAAGRGLNESQTAAVATGEVFTANQGQSMGLIDRIASLASVLNRTPAQPAQASARPVLAPPPVAQAIPAQATSTTATKVAPPEDQMKITAQALAALVAGFPIHSAFIVERALAGDEESTIRTALAAKDREATDKVITDLKAALASEQTAHKATADKLLALQAKHDALAALAAGAPKDPGTVPVDPNAAQTVKIKRSAYDENPAAFTADLSSGKAVLVDG